MVQTLAVELAGVKLKNPFLIGAGPYSCDGREIAKNLERIAEAGWAGVVLKSMSANRKLSSAYEPHPHLFPIIGRKGLIGMQNYGPLFTVIDDADLSGVIKAGRERGLVLIPSIIAETLEDWVYLACKCEECGAEMVELDLSCPCAPGKIRVEESAFIDLDPTLAKEVVSAITSKCKIPVIAKLGPNLFDLSPVAKAVEEGGAHAITAINTLRGLTGIDIDTGIPLCASANNKTVFSGLSGDVIRPVGLRCVAQIASSVNVPIFGVGGISNWESAVEYIMVGATGLQVCTEVMFRGFKVVEKLLKGLSAFLERKGYNNINDFRAKSLQYIAQDLYDLNQKPVVSTIDKDKCNGCGLCVTACKDGTSGAITLKEKKAIVDEDTCVGCGLCKTVCPVNAVNLAFKNCG